jgi:hypothetical protein
VIAFEGLQCAILGGFLNQTSERAQKALFWVKAMNSSAWEAEEVGAREGVGRDCSHCAREREGGNEDAASGLSLTF